MERELFRMVKDLLRRLGSRRRSHQQQYTDGAILEVYYWSVLNDRPVVWACQERHWPRGLRRGPLPSQSQMSRRLRTVSIRRLMCRIEAVVVPKPTTTALAVVIDGKPLPVARHSGDPHAGFGRGAGQSAMGYKIHALVDLAGQLVSWRLASLNIDERVMAKRLIRDMPQCAYLLADKNYDSMKLYEAAAQRGIQLIAPRRMGKGLGLGHRRRHPARLRAKQILEDNRSDFGRELTRSRRHIERYFANLTNFGGGLTHLPPWVRTYPRVHAWVRAKLVIAYLRRARRKLDSLQKAA
jgi:IS5 family transposase